jgi:ABC-type Na+ transport system ATPase subunit NatA
LGLDIRFRHILYRKLKEWKHNKLIILGTSDQAEADAVSDRVLVMQNGRAIDRSSQAGGRLMINLNLSFSSVSDWSRAKDIWKAHLKKRHVV